MASNKLISRKANRFGSQNEARNALGIFLTEQFPECIVEHRRSALWVIRGRNIYCQVTPKKKGDRVRLFGSVRLPWWFTFIGGPLFAALRRGSHQGAFNALTTEVRNVLLSDFEYRLPETFWEKVS